ncbi:MAG: hypothetical protein H5U33_24080, partial [Pseudomonas sp.]|nr:hypothetical protein [Pseudomonas sp.]
GPAFRQGRQADQSGTLFQGHPGLGKTILANQLACNHVRDGGRVLVATLLSESHERLFQYLSTLSFFDPALVGDSIQFVSAFDTLEQDGLDAVVRLLRQEIARQQATLLVVDGLLNARSRAETSLDTKKFVSELQGHAAFAGCTVLLLTSARLEEGSPEHTMVDGVIELGEHLVGSTAVRHVQLRKTRGSGALSGRHECQIDESGLQVYPRLEALYSRPSQQGAQTLARVATGVADLDGMLGGGLALSSVNRRDLQATEAQCIASLTDRELMVLQHLARGYSNKAIGEAMLLSNKTISTYKIRLLEKLRLSSLIDLADFARRNALI